MSGKFIEYEIDNMKENTKIYLIKGSRQKNKRVSLNKNYDQFK